MERTPAYQFTIRMKNGKPETFVGQVMLEDLRAHVKETNETATRKRYVKLQGRLGTDNPNAEKYRGSKRWNAYQCIHLKDAQTADVYVYFR